VPSLEEDEEKSELPDVLAKAQVAPKEVVADALVGRSTKSLSLSLSRARARSYIASHVYYTNA